MLLLLLFPAIAFGQRLSHPLGTHPADALAGPRASLSSPDTVRLLAIMVQFQQDSDSKTTGTGRFDLSSPRDSIIDAPPHDRRYFRDHLTFLENYYRRVSGGRVRIFSTLLDSVITLPAVMARYSPPKNANNKAVAELASDAWRAVDSLNLVSDFSLYRCFAVFHAGSGRDVDLVASLGYDPTPYDIPSLYFGPAAFEELLGPSFAGGIPVKGGSFRLGNTMVMPETDNRTLPAVGGEVLLELSINGLLCGAFGNFLGLPDLYDTKTGRSGIGRFGLMDGQAIFSYYGVFPPEPSAWERYWLGWVNPITVPVGTTSLALPATGLTLFSQSAPDTVYRIPISASEYFLIENRNRDPLRDGQTVTSTFNGTPQERHFARDTSGFEFADISALSGVITDVQDYDWSLPGGVDDQKNFYDGGILIWHIDESVIRNTMAGNAVNADPRHRGVDLEEADGSQDIGQSYGQFSAGSGSEEGTVLDFWFPGNPSPVYKNEFSSTTTPNTDGYAGTRSLVTVKAFSPRGVRMSTEVTLGDGAVRPLQGFPRTLNIRPFGSGDLLLEEVTGDSHPDILIAGSRAVYGFDSLGNPLGKSGLLALGDSTTIGFWIGVAALPASSAPARLFISRQHYVSSGMVSYIVQDADLDSLADLLYSVPLTSIPHSVPVVSDSFVVLGANMGRTYFLRFDGTLSDSATVGEARTDNRVYVGEFGGAYSYVLASSLGTVRIVSRPPLGNPAPPERTRTLSSTIVGPPAVGTFRTGNGDQVCVALPGGDGKLYLLDSNLDLIPGFPVDGGGLLSSSLALADIDGDGSRDIIAFTSEKIVVISSTGVMLDHFPVTLPSDSRIASHPIVADLNGDGLPDIAGATENGMVFAYDRRGAMLPGYPLQAGPGGHGLASYQVHLPDGKNGICLVVSSSDDASLSAWVVGVTESALPAGAFPWPQYQHDAQRSGRDLTSAPIVPLVSEYFPKSRAYNWPNPVVDGKTHIRYYVGVNSAVTIRIYDLSGDLVSELEGPGIGGYDNELVWDATKVQSGVYFARIEASGGGQSGSATIKIAVVR